ncbi:hypothetical protein SLS56_000974 [Neofusicoccum ribis]|uniref:Fungal calcium binding protein domain-containing protein n=1 Tax=Neofusicoccum ribis TaxID=45134 RepID=A0ABR3TBE2_9PEZI
MMFKPVTLITSLVAVTAIAAPADMVELEKRNETTAVAKNIQFAAAQADCSITSCASVLANSACIAIALATKNKQKLKDCAVGSAGALTDLCPCASCIPGLGDFLENQSIC